MRLLIAGGGTGGHLFPAIAIGNEFLKDEEKNEVLFIGTKKGIEGKILKIEGFNLKYINAKPIAGIGILGKIKAFLFMPISFIEAFGAIRRFKPDFVLGVGGYSSGPVVLCAKLMGIKTGIQEQNIIPGITNKILGKFADTVFLSFKEAMMSFKSDKVHLTGNPVRKDLSVSDKKKAYDIFLLDEDRFTIFIFGGSHGAESINKAFINNLNKLNRLKDKIQVIHQTGDKGYDFVKEGYERSEIKAFVAPFIYNMNDAYNVADVIVCRAGATTISEIAYLGKAAVLVPYPYAAADHQKANAMNLTSRRAAIMIEDKNLNEDLMYVLKDLYDNQGKLAELRRNIIKLKKLDAAHEIVKVIVKNIEGKKKNVSQS